MNTMDHGGAINKYLHKKFKKQTSIEPVPPPSPPSPPPAAKVSPQPQPLTAPVVHTPCFLKEFPSYAPAHNSHRLPPHVPNKRNCGVDEDDEEDADYMWDGHISTNHEERGGRLLTIAAANNQLKSSISGGREAGLEHADYHHHVRYQHYLYHQQHNLDYHNHHVHHNADHRPPDTSYTFVNYDEPAGATALVVRKVGGDTLPPINHAILNNNTNNTSSEQSDDDISSPSGKFNHTSGKMSSIYCDDAAMPFAPNASGAGAMATNAVNASSTSAASGGNGKYVCSFCNLACSKPSVLQKHIRAHTNERPYPCQSCNFSFKTRSNLYKHCRSRTHVNRVMGNNKTPSAQQEAMMLEAATSPSPSPPPPPAPPSAKTAPSGDVRFAQLMKNMSKPYKPRFHTKVFYDNENEENSLAISNDPQELPPHQHQHHYDDVDSRIPPVMETAAYLHESPSGEKTNDDQPLNLTSKNRKRCLSEVSSEPTKKSLIKELLLKNLYADTNMQCPHCKMIFRTFTELELHKMKSCKGRGSSRYSRSSSVNVASILTQNKNAFDTIRHADFVFPLKSPGPFLGKTRLVDSDKSKSFSCDDSIQGVGKESPSYYQSPSFNFLYDKRKPSLKLYGGEVKCVSTQEEDSTYRRGGGDDAEKDCEFVSAKMNENRVIRNTLQSGGIVQEKSEPPNPTSAKERRECANGGNGEYSIMDFSQHAAKMLAPNLKQLNLTIPGIPTPNKFIETAQPSLLAITRKTLAPAAAKVANGGGDPMNLLVNGKVVRYVPGMPGPVIAETIRPPKPIIQITPSLDDDPPTIHIKESPLLLSPIVPSVISSVKIEVPSPTVANTTSFLPPPSAASPLPLPSRFSYVPASTPSSMSTSPGVKTETFTQAPLDPPPTPPATRKFARPNSLALKPSSAFLKQNHGLTPTMFNKILISPDTPRGDKKYNEQFLHGNYFSYLGLKSSTRPVYCTLNKTQPFYVPHFKKLSMYSEWRQQDNKSDTLFVSNYDSRQRNGRVAVAGKYSADHVVHSSYKFILDEVTTKKEEQAAVSKAVGGDTVGGYESHEDYVSFVRGRDESTRNQEHEAAYGLLSLSQKVNNHTKEAPAPSPVGTPVQETVVAANSFINAEQLVHVSKTNYAKNKILDQNVSLGNIRLLGPTADPSSSHTVEEFAKSPLEGRLLTYPYTNIATRQIAGSSCSDKSSSQLSPEPSPREREPEVDRERKKEVERERVNERIRERERSPPANRPPERNIIHFNVIKRYNPPAPAATKAKDDHHEKPADATPQSAVAVKPTRDGAEAMDLSVPEKMPMFTSAFANKNVMNNNNRIKTPPAPKYPPADHYVIQSHPVQNGLIKMREYDNSAMETLADIATKQEKLEKNAVARNVATELLKLATATKKKKENAMEECTTYGAPAKNEMIVKTSSSTPAPASEENKNCTICNKTFSKPSQLRLHMNIHYLERPYRCESCSVSFRTKGHLQKHERSAGHHNKLSSSPAQSSREPRPFKCTDCSIAFRIHGHLAKHLRSKMHILKLECLSKIPFGLYAELERSNSLLTEINTADGEQCLDSLKALARRIFVNDPSKLSQLNQMNDGAKSEYRGADTIGS